MKNLLSITIILIASLSYGQQVLTRTNTSTTTNKSWQIYRQNSPTNVYGNSQVLFEVNYDSTYLRSNFVRIDVLDNRTSILPGKKYISADNSGNLTQGSFDNLTFTISQIVNLNTMLMDRPTLADGMLLYKPIGYIPTYTDVITGLGYVPYNATLNPNGYITSNNVYNAGTGLSASGTVPNVTFSIDQSQVMTVSRATDSIASLDTKINGKVPASRSLTINGTTQDLSANRTWSNVGIELPSQTGQSGKYLTTNGTAVSWQTVAGTSYTAGTGISIASNVVTNTAPDQTVSITSGRGISVTGTYPNFTISLVTPTISIASRTLNSNFTVSTTKEAFVAYSVTCQVTNPLLVGSSVANAYLEYSTNGGSTWLLPSQQTNSSGVGVTVTVQLTNAQTGVISGYIPANALVRIRTTTTGTASVTYVTGQETVY